MQAGAGRGRHPGGRGGQAAACSRPNRPRELLACFEALLQPADDGRLRARAGDACCSASTPAASTRLDHDDDWRSANGSCVRWPGASAGSGTARWRWCRDLCAAQCRTPAAAARRRAPPDQLHCSWPSCCRKPMRARWACTAWSTGCARSIADADANDETAVAAPGIGRAPRADPDPAQEPRAWNFRWCSCPSSASAATTETPARALPGARLRERPRAALEAGQGRRLAALERRGGRVGTRTACRRRAPAVRRPDPRRTRAVAGLRRFLQARQCRAGADARACWTQLQGRHRHRDRCTCSPQGLPRRCTPESDAARAARRASAQRVGAARLVGLQLHPAGKADAGEYGATAPRRWTRSGAGDEPDIVLDEAAASPVAFDTRFSGSRFGNVLHEALEHVDFARLARLAATRPRRPARTQALREALPAEATRQADVDDGIAELAPLVGRTLTVPLPEGARLCELPAGAAPRRNRIPFRAAAHRRSMRCCSCCTRMAWPASAAPSACAGSWKA